MNADGFSWILLGLPHQGSTSAGIDAVTTGYQDEWLYTGCLQLSSALTYQLSYYLKSSDLTSPTLMDVSIGNNNFRLVFPYGCYYF